VVLWETYAASAVCSGPTCSVTPGVLLLDGDHRWWVRPHNGPIPGGWSGPMAFTVERIPTLVYPLGDVGTDSNPTYQWTGVNGADQYEILVNDPLGGTVLDQTHAVGDVCTGLDCSLFPNVQLTQAGAYRWWVRAIFGGTPGLWSARGDFTVPGPGQPTLIYPTGSIGDNTNPNYQWNAASDATQYQLLVMQGSTTIIDQMYAAGTVCPGATCSVQTGTALGPGTYRWWVRAFNGPVAGSWSLYLDFTISPIPTLIYPLGDVGTDLNPTYQWTALSTATQYHLYSDRVGGGFLIDQVYDASAVCSGGTCSVSPGTPLTLTGEYHWWVAGVFGGVQGDWSARGDYFVYAPGQTTTIAPTGSIGANNNPTYEWNATAHASRYQLYVERNGAPVAFIDQFYDASAVCSGGTCSVATGVNHTAANYRWWIRPYNGTTIPGSWSVARDFTVTP
jgi:hypothetical protein